MAVPRSGCTVVADLVVPGRAAAAMERLDEYEFEGHEPADQRCPYDRKLLTVWVSVPSGDRQAG